MCSVILDPTGDSGNIKVVKKYEVYNDPNEKSNTNDEGDNEALE